MKLRPGAIVERRGRSYRLIERQPYTRLHDGAASELLWWEATCDVCRRKFLHASGAEPNLVNLKAATCHMHRRQRPSRLQRKTHRRRPRTLADIL